MAGAARRHRRPPVDGRDQHRDWLSLVEVDGPFLTLPVLTRVWPTLTAVDSTTMESLRDALAYAERKPRSWIEYAVAELLDWQELATWQPAGLGWHDREHDVMIECDFALTSPVSNSEALDGHPDIYLLGFVLDPDQDPRARVAGDDWSATCIDRAAAACRGLGVPLALVSNGRLWTLVWAPRGGVTTHVTFDSVSWADSSDRVVVRAFVSLLGRRSFTAVPDDQQLPALLLESLDAQEEITEELGRNVRRAVEQLVESMGRWDAREAAVARPGLGEVDPHEVYHGAVTMLMRLMFLFFAEERGLLPADNAVYVAGYGASPLCERLEAEAQDAGEEALEHRTGAWLQLLATSAAVHVGVRSAELRLPAYDGSLFDPRVHRWLAAVSIDDRTLLHVLRAVQYVVIRRERRRVSFRTLEVEQIGYVYEGLLAYEAQRASQLTLGLIGKAGLEEEVPLPELERRRGQHTDSLGVVDHESLAAALAEELKASGIGSVKRLTALLAPPDEAEQARRLPRLLAVTEGDRSQAMRIMPFAGLLRDDLRGLPTVIPAHSLYVTASAARAKSGAHYTPSWLAKDVTERALLPLVYASPGPLDNDDQAVWRPASASQIVGLKVADIAMGSGAFLVAACRFLADRLVAAWAIEGDADARDHLLRQGDEGAMLSVDGAVAPVVTRARRTIIEHCLYGTDINPMAVEMAKLSLWLVSMQPGRPFTFLDDRLVAGDSLLGVAGIEQLEALHMNARAGRRIHGKWVNDPTAGIRSLLADLAAERRTLAELPGADLGQLGTKRERLASVDRLRWRADLLADLVVGSSLAGATLGERGLKIASKDLGALAEELIGQAQDSDAVTSGRELADAWLALDRPDGAEDRRPLHWPLIFPEVFGDHGGFDGIVGNPPFLGGKKITGAVGTTYRNYLLHAIGRSARGNADLVAYFVLRIHELLNTRGQSGLIATNTLAQGDTREVGLDQLEADGVIVKAAIKSEPWPSKGAVLEYCAIWTSKRAVDADVDRILDHQPAPSITPSLDAGSRASGTPHRLTANAGICFQGSVVLGMGFVMEPDRARLLLKADPRNAEVLFPYLNGEDLNSRPDSSARRWVINFHDWSEERAASYAALFKVVESEVKPERQKLKPDGQFALRKPLPQRYWQYADKRPALTAALSPLDRAIAITLVSKVVMPVMVPTGQVFSHALGVFASDDEALFALLSSSPHYWWAIQRSSTLETRIRYTPTDVFETFARPVLGDRLRHLGHGLDQHRRDLMLARQAGLTATYNLVHDPACTDDDIVGLRALHRDIDHAVFDAYGWTDLDPVHDHVETRQGIRWTIDPVTRQEMLDRLLELNQQRYAEQGGDAAAADDSGRLF